MKRNRIFFIIILTSFILPTLNADIIMSGYKSLSIENKIINFEEFPNYKFISVGNWSNCNIEFITGGIISSQYKGCDVDVYAIPNQNFNEAEIIGLWRDYVKQNNYGKFKLFIENNSGKKVITDVVSYKTVPETSIVLKEINEYTLNKETLELENKKTIRKMDYVGQYTYISLSIIALIIILFILIKRK